MPKHIAKWNPARDAWEDTRGGTSLFCGHSDVYSGTFPASGMTVSGVAYELQTWEHRTGDTGYSSSQNDDDELVSLFPTPSAGVFNDAEDVASWDARRERVKATQVNGNGMGEPLTIAAKRLALLPTPSANVGTNGGSQDPDKRRAGGHQPSIQDVAEHQLLPTPTRQDGANSGGPSQFSRNTIPLNAQVVDRATDWGKFAPAIERWEQSLGRPAPDPTVPDGRGGKHRLNPAFVEFMMGLPMGWVTDVDISRNDQLKALGNGVVPQQCTAALRDMLANTEAGQVAA